MQLGALVVSSSRSEIDELVAPDGAASWVSLLRLADGRVARRPPLSDDQEGGVTDRTIYWAHAAFRGSAPLPLDELPCPLDLQPSFLAGFPSSLGL